MSSAAAARRTWLHPLARAAAVGLVSAAVLLGATRLGPLPEGSNPSAGERIPATNVTTHCPGDPFDDASAVDIAGTVTAHAAPAEVLEGLITPVDEKGRIAVTDVGATSDAAREDGDELSGAVQVRATGDQAPGVTAVQSFTAGGEQSTGLAAVPCATPTADAWLVGGGAAAGRQERLVLVNPGGNAVTVRVDALGGSAEETVVVPATGRSVVLLDAIGGTDSPQAVHVTTEGGLVVPTLVDHHLDGLTPAGVETVAPTTSPATRQVIPATADGSEHSLVVGVPGDSDAVVQVRSLTPEGSRSATVVTAPKGAASDVELPDVPGVHAWLVESDEPVVAAAQQTTAAADGTRDMSWSVATEAFGSLGGVALPAAGPGVRRYVNVVAATAPAQAEVLTLQDGTVTTKKVTLEKGHSAALHVGPADAVWVRPTRGSVHAAVLLVGREGDARARTTSLPIDPSRVAVRDVSVVRQR